MYKRTFFLSLILLFTFNVSASQVQLQAFNSQEETVSANYTVEQNGEVLVSSIDSLDTSLNSGENYTFIQAFKLGEDSFNVTIHDLNLTSDFNPDINVVDYSADTYLKEAEKVYALKGIDLDYNTAELEYSRINAPDAIFHCTDYNFTSDECRSSQLEEPSSYSYSTDPFKFNTTSFSSYTVGNTSPRLNLSNIQIHNVTGLTAEEKMNKGDLVDEGLNKTFEILQKSKNSYRFTFNINNTGTENWSIQEEDLIVHEGLSQDWSVGEIWYNVNGVETGGTFSLGDLEWNTSSNGELSQDGTMNASYLVNITEETSTYQQAFNTSDISNGEQAYDTHELRVQQPGEIDVEMYTPPNNSILRQNGTFYINANVSCSSYDCGTTNATPRYNSSTGQKIIPEGSGQPFYLKEDALKQCELQAGETCSLNWTANATGDLESKHLLDVNSSASEGLSSDTSNKTLVEIDTVISMDLTFDVIDFGFLDPGASGQPAEGNSEDKYNISVSDNSKPIDDLWVKGTDLVSEVDPDYVIGVSNISYGLENDIADSESLEKSYTHLKSNVDPGTNVSTYYWIDVPFGMTQSGYNGTITFKANSTD